MNTEKNCVSMSLDEYRKFIRVQRDLEILKAMLASYQDEKFGVSRNELDSIYKLFFDDQQDESW